MDTHQQKLNILVVDDVQLTQCTIAGLLSAEPGFQLFEEENGEKALERLKTSKIDCVIYDWHLPSLGKARLASRIRALDKKLGRYTFIVIHINPPEPDWVNEAFEAEIDDYISNTHLQEVSPRLKNMARLCLERKKLVLEKKRIQMNFQRQKKYLHLDPTTSLHNLITTQTYFKQAADQCENRGGSLNLLLMHIKNCEALKTKLSPPAFTQLMSHLGARFRKVVRPLDHIGRLNVSDFLWVCVSSFEQSPKTLGFKRLVESVGTKVYETNQTYVELELVSVAIKLDFANLLLSDPKTQFEDILNYMRSQLEYLNPKQNLVYTQWPPQLPELLPLSEENPGRYR